MHIFIDESGLFIPSTNKNQWSSVGAIVVPDEAVPKVQKALVKLKKEAGLEDNVEFDKNRPNSDSKPFLHFLRSLKRNKCTLHVSSTSGSINDLNNIQTHKEETIKAIARYCKERNYSTEEYNEIKTLITRLSPQQYNQIIHQSYMINNLIGKVISLYAQLTPKSLSKFVWTVDQKNQKETTYDKVFKKLYVGLIEVASKNSPFHILEIKKSNFVYFYNSNFVINDKSQINELHYETKELYKKDFGKNEKYLQAMDLREILSNYTPKASKESFGLQVADLLISSINRCLKRNFTNNELMAQELGKLMINSHRENQKSILLSTFSEQYEVAEEVSKLINIMDNESIKLYKFKKEIYSKNI